jgi:hypothetical protein
MPKLNPNQKQVGLAFLRPEDIVLHGRLEKMAHERRYSLPTFILLALHDAFREDGSPSVGPVLE